MCLCLKFYHYLFYNPLGLSLPFRFVHLSTFLLWSTLDVILTVHHVLLSLPQKNMPNAPPQGSSAS